MLVQNAPDLTKPSNITLKDIKLEISVIDLKKT